VQHGNMKKKPTMAKDKKSLLGTAGKAVLGLGVAAATAYGMHLLGRPGARRRPVTEIANALNLRLKYVPWADLHYAYYVRPGKGRPLVFLHSINAAASAHEMRPLVQRFQRETDRPLYALEWLGFGHSDRPELRYTPMVMEDQLEHFLEHIVRAKGGADIVGLSLGATYAAGVAPRRQDLVRSLVAIEPAGLGREHGEIGRVWAGLLFTVPGVQRAFYDRLTTPDALYSFARENLFTDEFGVPDDFVEFGAETARAEGAARPLDDFLSGRMFPNDAKDIFLHLRQPMLVIHGTVQDRRMESYTDLPRLSARQSVTVLPLATGALPHWERPGVVTDAIQKFLDETAPQEAEPVSER
jgi:pimeloyl-ACP methyl ester carboxylesterase